MSGALVDAVGDALLRRARRLSIVAPDQGDDGMAMGFELSPEEVETFTAELARLREEHRDLDSAIDALERVGAINQIQVQRLKKRKLYLKDRIAQIEDALTPDIIA
jgi:hypothetical protein